MSHLTDEDYMKLAIREARKAERGGDVPVGAVLVSRYSGEVIARGFNLREKNLDPCGHAEIVVLRKAAKKLKTWRLSEFVLYVTLEPCVMCAGALVLGRVGRVVYGATDPKAGAIESLFKIWDEPGLNHHPKVTSGVLLNDCQKILKEFFKNRRSENRKSRQE